MQVQANALREELHTEIEHIVNDVVKFKVHIQKSLSDYETFVIDETERELMEYAEESPPPSPSPAAAAGEGKEEGEAGAGVPT